MTQPVILLSDILLDRMAERLEPAYRVEKLWEHERAAFLAGPGREVEAIIHAGEVVLDPDLIEALPKLKLIACVSVGYDGINVPHARARGIEVTHARWLNAPDVADFAVGLMIAAFRGIVAGHEQVMSGGWERREPLRPFGSLTGKAVGVVGLGHIGAAIARRAEAMDMKVGWWGPRAKDAPWPMAGSLLALAEASDVLIVACRADETNKAMIGAEVMAALGKRGLLVNISRGSVVDEDALIAALHAKTLGMAALDVFWREPTPAGRWTGVPNLIVTPHLAGSSAETVVRLVGQAMENLRRHFAGEPLLSPAPEK
jgi:lactate dehydrogenase-like 2-hydroxyacid dehydrogenase